MPRDFHLQLSISIPHWESTSHLILKNSFSIGKPPYVTTLSAIKAASIPFPEYEQVSPKIMS